MLASFWRLLFGPEPRATSEEAAVPIISQQEALAIAKSLAVRSGHFWDDETARVWWCKSPPPVPSWAVTAGHEPKPTAPCWAVMTGQEPKHWLDRYTDDGLTLLIDAQTGAFTGIDIGRYVVPASSVAKRFEPRGLRDSG
jgi:hypothetical protein